MIESVKKDRHDPLHYLYYKLTGHHTDGTAGEENSFHVHNIRHIMMSKNQKRRQAQRFKIE